MSVWWASLVPSGTSAVGILPRTWWHPMSPSGLGCFDPPFFSFLFFYVFCITSRVGKQAGAGGFGSKSSWILFRAPISRLLSFCSFWLISHLVEHHRSGSRHAPPSPFLFSRSPCSLFVVFLLCVCALRKEKSAPAAAASASRSLSVSSPVGSL